jgi:molybdopterin-guanine dinucleotide biosynthesis protein A
VFVASCDLVRFDARVVDVLQGAILKSPWPGPIASRHCAAVPEIDGRLQPLCALYTKSAIGEAATALARGAHRITEMMETIEVFPVYEGAFLSSGVNPRAVLGANTPDELRTLLSDDPY